VGGSSGASWAVKDLMLAADIMASTNFTGKPLSE